METRTTGPGLHLIKRFEACELDWYRCPANVWTIGWGTTEGLLPGVTRSELPGPIDGSRADRLLRRSLLQVFEPQVERLVETPLTSYRFDALVSFTYNVGVGNFRRSTLRVHLNAGRYRRAAEEFSRWIYSGGRPLKGLVKRREAERRMFEGEVSRAMEVDAERLAPRPVQRAPIKLPRLDRLRGYVPTATQSDGSETSYA